MTALHIGPFAVGADLPPLTILEAGINHNGDLDLAREMIQVAKRAGADAIKFQTFKSDEFVGDPTLTFTYRSQGQEVTEPMIDLFRRVEFSVDSWRALRRACDEAGILFLSTPQNRTDLDLLLTLGIPAIKVGSDDFTNLPLLRDYAREKLPMLLSCGMADLGEVHAALQAVGALDGAPVVLLVCTSQYPTPPDDANVRRVATLRAAFPGLMVGFSDHTEGAAAAVAALALGARVFEKHFTLDRNLPGPDHWFSEDPQTAAAWVQAIKSGYRMLGSGAVQPSAAEREMRILARRSVVALRPIAAGEIFDAANTGLRRPGDGLAPQFLDVVLGRRAARAIPAATRIGWEDLA